MKHLLLLALVLIANVLFAQQEQCAKCQECLPLAKEVQQNASEYEKLRDAYNYNNQNGLSNVEINSKMRGNRSQARDLQDKLSATGCWSYINVTDCDNFCKDQQAVKDARGREVYTQGKTFSLNHRGVNALVKVGSGEIYYDIETNTIETPINANAFVDYEDGTRLQLKAGSKVQIEPDQLIIQNGSTRIEVTKRGKTFEVKTPTALTSIKGTDLEVKVNPDKSTEVYLYEGQVSVSNNTGEIILNAGEMLIVSNINQQLELYKFNPANPSQTWKPETGKQKVNPPASSANTIKGNGWLIHWTDGELTGIEPDVNYYLEEGYLPVGFAAGENANYLMYLIEDPFNVSEWKLNWTHNINDAKNQISAMINQGYLPMGISFTNSGQFNVFYIKCDVQASDYRLIESPADLQMVYENINYLTTQGYIPVGISVFGSSYYSLLVKIPQLPGSSWTIEGYNDDPVDIQIGVNEVIRNGLLPFGYLKEGNIINVLYVKF